ncbi:hypothetical protein M4D51_02810 [Microbacterium sp. p3-SID338]|uniref:hypothetical protein n=1 Tax=Microbacterium sp. p3-SID338 TaxID=2916214 RepID=UPI0021A5D0A1|nr:hypothetical protein [Microbacterium sp. p3-SID338]MCT1394650.1 hypothetical protein [Microbacterium sp. p3-SID338]
MVRLDEASETTKTVSVDPFSKNESDAAGGLAGDVVGGDIRPGKGELGGALPDDSDHAPHAMSAGSGYVFNHPLWPALEEYRPDDTHLWEDIRDMVTHIVAVSVRPGLKRPSVRMKLARDFILYTHEHLGVELDLEELFTEHNARMFLQYGHQAGYPRALHPHYPALARMVLAVTGVRPDMKVFQPSVPAPYSPKELARCVSVVQTMRTTQRKRAGMLVFALAAGAGLSTRELIDVRWTDVDNDCVDVRGPHPRTVPILPDYRDQLVREEHEQEDGYVLLPHLPRDNTNIISNFLSRLPAGRPNVRRLRATFHFALLSHGISAQDFVYLSGRESFTSLDAYLPLLPDRGSDLLETIDSLFTKDHS